MNLNYTNQKKKSGVLQLGIAPSKITNFPPFLTLQLLKSTAFGEGLCFKLQYATQKLYQFFNLFIIFINLFFLPLSFLHRNDELI